MNETHIVTNQVSPLLDSSLPAAVLNSYRTFDIVEIERYDDLTIIPFVHFRRSSRDMVERVQTTVLECR